MIKSCFLSCLAGLLMSLVPMSVLAGADPGTASGTDAGDRLVVLLSPLHSLSGEFEQTQTDANGSLLSQSSGRFSMQRPGQVRWETTSPFPQLLVSDGELLYIYDPDLEQVSVSALGDQLQHTPAVIFSGDLAAIEQSYRIESPSAGVFELVPHAPEQSQFQRLTLTFDGEQLAAMGLFDGFGQQTRVEFQRLRVNPDIDTGLFHFAPPPGTDILRHE